MNQIDTCNKPVGLSLNSSAISGILSEAKLHRSCRRWLIRSATKGAIGAFELNGSVTEEWVGVTAADRPALRVPSSV
ncbi:hypothetical protein ANTQUA_LOCUS918 [Anthophora quadrimaculata]